jgi:uncharacterized Zn finger protein
MTCSRCCGHMVEIQVLDMEGAYGEMWATSRRCVNCGHVYDAVIEQHRRTQQQHVLVFSSGESDYQDDEANLGTASILRRAA